MTLNHIFVPKMPVFKFFRPLCGDHHNRVCSLSDNELKIVSECRDNRRFI